MTAIALPQRNYYAGWQAEALAARRAQRGQLEGLLPAMAIYCLRTCGRPVRRINDQRLLELFSKQRPGLVSQPRPGVLRVRLRPFKAWVLRNVDRIAMTKEEIRQERVDQEMHLIDSYMLTGPHFFNEDHRAEWERIRNH